MSYSKIANNYIPNVLRKWWKYEIITKHYN